MKKIFKNSKQNILNDYIKIFNNLKEDNIKRNFIESIDISIVLNMDIKDINKNILGNVILPHGNGKKYKILVLDNNIDKNLVLSWGVNLSNIENLINNKNYINNFNLIITTVNYFNNFNSKIFNILGSKNKIPDLKLGTITNNLKDTVYDFLNGKVIYKNDKFGVINLCIGKINFDNYKLADNLFVFLNSVKLYISKFNRKLIFIKKIFVSSTMGKSYIIKI